MVFPGNVYLFLLIICSELTLVVLNISIWFDRSEMEYVELIPGSVSHVLLFLGDYQVGNDWVLWCQRVLYSA